MVKLTRQADCYPDQVPGTDYTYICTYGWVDALYACVHISVYVWMDARMYACMHVCIYMHICICICLYIDTHTHTHTHTHMHASHTHS